MFFRPNIEVNLVEHCNLTCYGCDHDSPSSRKHFAPLEQFREDLNRLAAVLRVDELRLLGGEPLLHPDVLGFLDAARASGIAQKVVLVTNGVLLHKADPGLWRRIDRLWLSVYPGVDRQMSTDQVAAACAAHGAEFHADVIHHFFRTLTNQPIEDPILVKAIYRACKTAQEWSCHTVYEGGFYKCPTAALTPARLARMGEVFVEGEADSVRIEGPDLEGRLDRYLKSPEPLAACAWCLGSSGPPISHHQMDRSSRRALEAEDHQEVIRTVRRALLGEAVADAVGSTAGLEGSRLAALRSGAARAGRVLREVAAVNGWRRRALRPAGLLAAALRGAPGRGERPAETLRQGPRGEDYRRTLAWLRSLAESVAGRPGVPLALAASAGGVLRTLVDAGERPLGAALADPLIGAQRASGSWPPPRAGSSRQATARAVSGILALPPSPRFDRAARRGALRLAARLVNPSPLDTLLGLAAPDASQVAILASLVALRQARDRFGSEVPAVEALPWVQRWLDRPPRPSASDLAVHVHDSAALALLELGRVDAAAERARDALSRQLPDGSLARAFDRREACSTCTALAAGVWSRLGHLEPARRALTFLGSRLSPSGALVGSLGPGAHYLPDEPDADAGIAFIDSFHAFLAASFDAQVERFLKEPAPDPGRVQLVLSQLGPLAGRKVLDAGCGCGVVARAIARAEPRAEVWGLDHSARMLEHLPSAMPRRRGSLQNMPFPDASFDAVYSLEALEHACNPEGAVRELCRVTRPGGRIVIIDKNASRAGALEIETWERWFGREEVLGWLDAWCQPPGARTFAVEGGPPNDLFIGWQGTRARDPSERLGEQGVEALRQLQGRPGTHLDAR